MTKDNAAAAQLIDASPPTALLRLATVFILAIALVQCVVTVLPQVYWDIDPRSEAARAPLTTFGPVEAAWLAMASIAATAFALVVHRRAGGKLSIVGGILTLIGIGVTIYHQPAHIDNLYVGGAWIGAITLAYGAYHLAQHDWPRRYMFAAMMAMVIPFTFDALLNVFIHHPNTVEHFQRNEAEILRARGWEYGSPQHILYKRRLEFPDVVGAFGLSNVFGSLVAAIFILTSAAAVSLFKSKLTRRAWLIALLAVAAFVTLYLTHSKGALAGLFGGVALWVCILIAKKLPGKGVLGPICALVLVAGAFLAVIARGQLGEPPTHEGERSILFRYHYWTGAVNIFTDLPAKEKLLGVGPMQFKPHYTQHKPPLNPEEVTSTHNVFIDYLATLGIGGLAWSALLLAWLWIAVGGASRETDDRRKQSDGNEPNNSRKVTASPKAATQTTSQQQANAMADAAARDANTQTGWTVLLCALVFGTQFIVVYPANLTIESLLAFCFGVIGFLFVTATCSLPGWFDIHTQRLGLTLGAGMLLIHNQIEMLYFQTGSAAIGLVFVAIAAGAGQPIYRDPNEQHKPQLRSWPKAILPAVPVIALGGYLLISFAIPTTQYHGIMKRAAIALQKNNPIGAIENLTAAARIIPNDPASYRWRTTIHTQQAQALAQSGNLQAAQQAILDAEAVNKEAEATGVDSVSLLRGRAQLQEYAANLLNQPARRSIAISLWTQVLQRNPYGLQDHVRYANLLWQTGRRDEARDVYRKCLELSEQAYLDPAKQLTDREKRAIEKRVGNAD